MSRVTVIVIIIKSDLGTVLIGLRDVDDFHVSQILELDLFLPFGITHY